MCPDDAATAARRAERLSRASRELDQALVRYQAARDGELARTARGFATLAPAPAAGLIQALETRRAGSSLELLRALEPAALGRVLEALAAREPELASRLLASLTGGQF